MLLLGCSRLAQSRKRKPLEHHLLQTRGPSGHPTNSIKALNVIIIMMITEMIFMVLLSWQSHTESSPGSFDECRLSAEVAANPQTKPTDLDCESARKKWQLPSVSTIAIYYYSARELILILPSHGGWKAEST